MNKNEIIQFVDVILNLVFDECIHQTCCDCKTHRTDCKKAVISKIKKLVEVSYKELKETKK